MRKGVAKPPRRFSGDGQGYTDNVVGLVCGHSLLFASGVPAPERGDYVHCYRCGHAAMVESTVNQWVAECLDCDLAGHGDSWGERLHTCKSGIKNLMDHHNAETGHSNMRWHIVRHSGPKQQGKVAEWRYWKGNN
jgi:hypothetical protein